mmetsp:Transcript_111753/g.219073  ORF Transcript_111753/g.219073 Transcript_111753/m.219073 type:complete len:264 (-) Transcript_111753:60-851(-)
MNQLTGQLFKLEDLQPGMIVKVYNHEFEILDQDDYTTKLMEDPDKQCKAFDHESVVQKLRESLRQQYPLVRDVFRRFDGNHDGVLTISEFRAALEKFGFSNLPDDFVTTLLRHFDTRQDGQVSYNEFCDTLLDEDFPVGMLKTKPPVQPHHDPDYADRANYKVVERDETAAVRKAVRAFGEILSKRGSMMTRLIKEFGHITHEGTASVLQIHHVLKQCGQSMEPEDIQRAVLHLMPEVDLERIPYVEFLKAVHTGFHDVYGSR